MPSQATFIFFPCRLFLLGALSSSLLLPSCRSYLIIAPSSSSLLLPRRSFQHFSDTKHCSFLSESLNIVVSSKLRKALRTNQPTDRPTNRRTHLKRWNKFEKRKEDASLVAQTSLCMTAFSSKIPLEQPVGLSRPDSCLPDSIPRDGTQPPISCFWEDTA